MLGERLERRPPARLNSSIDMLAASQVIVSYSQTIEDMAGKIGSALLKKQLGEDTTPSEEFLSACYQIAARQVACEVIRRDRLEKDKKGDYQVPMGEEEAKRAVLLVIGYAQAIYTYLAYEQSHGRLTR